MKLRFEPVRKLCVAAAEDGTVPGLVLLVAADGGIAFHDAFGARQLVPRKLPVFPDTLFDVASITKAVVTSVLAMHEVATGRLALELPVVELLPEFAAAASGASGASGATWDRSRVTVRQLLCHSSGLPAHRPFWRQAAESPSERRAIALLAAREPLEYEPGTRSVYSDLGFIVLGWLLERMSGERLDVAARRQIAAPLGLEATTYMSLSDPDDRARVLGDRSIAATQLCPERHRVLIGEVDDLNAMAMGGVAGHAGLFSTAEELSRIAAALCGAWRGDGAGAGGGGPLVDRDVIRTFWSPSGIPGSTWRLGWDGPAAANSQAGTRFSRAGVGHLGFTGCSLWIDPARDTWIVMLSNRVHPALPKDDRFKRFRPLLHDAIVDALGS